MITGVGGQEAGDEQQRVARQKESDEKTRLGEDDQRQQREAAFVENLLGFEEVDQGEKRGEHERGRLQGLTPIASEGARPF